MRLSLTSLFLLGCALFAQPPEPVDLVVSAARVVTMNPSRDVIEGGAVAIRAGRIVAAAPLDQINRRYSPKTRIDRPGAILTPGLINTHTHAPMSLLRGIADDLILQDWLEKYIFPAEAKNVSPEFVEAGARLAILEMLLSGTTTYTDMYYFEDVMARVTKAAGMRAVLGQTLIGFPVADFKTPGDALAGAEQFILRWKNDSLITPAPAPHAIYTNSAATLKAAAALADRHGVPMLIHVSETKREQDECLSKHGLTPTAYLDSIGAIASRTLFAHGVWMTPSDIALAARRRIGVAHCPSSNMKLASGAAPVAAMLDAGVAVGLGPDGPAGSNNDFSMFEEMDLAAKLAKVTTMDPRALPAPTVFEMATIGGARALGMEREIGSIEPGKRADLITVSTAAPHAVPEHGVYSMLVYALKGSDVLDVVIEGRPVVRARQPLTLNAAEVIARARAFRAKIEASLKDSRP
jgi:5-methylthioadenosine/S-adenosylhomocysteine deaminase